MTARPRKFLVADLLCGAGGSSTGCIRALLELGWALEEIILACVNHWDIAIETHRRNHPHARHVLQDIATARPHIIVPEGYLDLLLASPTCTHHSLARGGKPTSDQQRSDPWHIITWFTELRVKRAIIENVWEWRKWGPVDQRTGKSIKSREGEYFNAYIDTIRRLGATSIEWRKLNAADFGEATTRSRFIMMMRFDGKPLVWPVMTHHKRQEGNLELFPTLKPWRPARDIINWKVRGRSIFGRPKPLSWKSLDRLLAGILRFAWPAIYVEILLPEIERSLIHAIRENLRERREGAKAKRQKARRRVCQAIARLRQLRTDPPVGSDSTGLPQPMIVTLRQNADGRSLALPLPAILAEGQHIGIAEPVILNGRKNGKALGVSESPIPALDTKGGVWLAEPFVLSQASGGAPRSVSDPLPTAPTGGAHALIAPYYGSGSGETCTSTNVPLPAITSKARFGIVMPITHNDGSDRARDVDIDPLPTLTTANRGELAFITASFGEREGQTPRTHSVDKPAPALCATGRINLVEGRKYDILYRMLDPDELAAAMGFTGDDAVYEFAGTKTEKIKQIGNAVSVRKMQACVLAIAADAAPRKISPAVIESLPAAVGL